MKLKIVAVTTLGLLGLNAAHANSNAIPHENNPGYVWDTQGNVVRDGFGGCVRTINWTKETAIPRCEGIVEPEKVVEKPKPIVVPVVAPKPAPVVAEPAIVVPEKSVVNYKFDNANFDQATGVSGDLSAIADFAKANPNATVVISGHTCTMGSRAYNEALAKNRANAVQAHLVFRGVPAKQIQTAGYAYDKPVASNDTEQGRAQNRRAEVEIKQ